MSENSSKTSSPTPPINQAAHSPMTFSFRTIDTASAQSSCITKPLRTSRTNSTLLMASNVLLRWFFYIYFAMSQQIGQRPARPKISALLPDDWISVEITSWKITIMVSKPYRNRNVGLFYRKCCGDVVLTLLRHMTSVRHSSYSTRRTTAENPWTRQTCSKPTIFINWTFKATIALVKTIKTSVVSGWIARRYRESGSYSTTICSESNVGP